MSTTTTMSLTLGTILAGKYRLDAVLGAGGMGYVYRAFNTMLEREVALKLLRPEFAVNEESTARFLAEARAANAVRHPHVVDVLDVAVEDGVPFIVQEFLQGETLATRLEQQVRLSIVDTLDVLTPIAAALSHAHKQGIVHRDIKPENIFLSESGGAIVPKLLDFGIAQSLREEFASDEIIAGTPAYMAPELVIDPQERDVRSDLWSLGVVIFECLTGRLPFDGKTPSQMFSAICHDEPIAIEQLRPDLPNELTQLVMRCLARDPSKRFETGRALLEALESMRDQLRGKGTSRVRWHSTLAPGTLRAPKPTPPRAPRDPELVVTSDDVAAAVVEGKRSGTTPVAITASDRSAPLEAKPAASTPVATSEPPAKIITVTGTLTARSKTPARATVALALALATLAVIPLLFSQRRRSDAAPRSPSVVAASDARLAQPEPRAAATSAPAAVIHATPVVEPSLPVAAPTIGNAALDDAGSLGARNNTVDPPRVGATVTSRRVRSRNGREGRDASAPVAPLIQLRDER
ncbi:MAG: protein kinase [Polyangiales bacterium]